TRIARIIRSFDPDIVALQEVDLKRARSKGEDQISRLARELAMQSAFCCTADRAWEKYGHALLSRFPIEVIASGLFSGEEQLEEPRGVMVAKVRTKDRDVFVANTHFGLRATQRLTQMQTLVGDEWLGRVPPDARLIVCGDFNMSQKSRAYQLITERLQRAQKIASRSSGFSSFPAPIPLSRIDFIFFSNHFTVENMRTPRHLQTPPASD